MRQLFTLPGYARWFAGRAASWLGGSLLTLVLSIWVKSLTGSSSKAILNFVFLAIPALCAPFIGVLIDRYHPRPALVIGNALAAVALLPLFWVSNHKDVPLIWATSFVYGMANATMQSASTAMMRSLVPKDELAAPNGLASTVGQVTALVGPPLGAGLFAASGPFMPACISMALFAIAAAVFTSLRTDRKVPREVGKPWEAITAGIRHIWNARLLRHGLVSLLIIELIGGFVQGSYWAVLDTFQRPPEFAGVLMLSMGLGAVLGAALSGQIVGGLGEVRAMIAAMSYLVVGIVIVTLSPTIWIFVVLIALIAPAIPVVYVAYETLLQGGTPIELMGRVQAATAPLFSLCVIASFGVAALIVEHVPVWACYLGIATVIALAALYLAIYGRHPEAIESKPQGA